MKRLLYLTQMLLNSHRPAATLIARQRQLAQLLIRRAIRDVPFYAQLYRAKDIGPDFTLTTESLQQLPVIDKSDLRAAGRAAIARDAPAEQVHISTSGSSGEPFTFPIDRDYDRWRKAQYLRPYLVTGRRLRDKSLRLTGFPRERQPWFTKFGILRARLCGCASDPAALLNEWQRFAPHVLEGYPSALRALAQYCRATGRAPQPQPRLVYTDSELLLPDTRALLEDQFGAPVLDVFGTLETDNIAFQCPLRTGYHVATDSVLLEIVRDGKAVPPGTQGEIVVTVLHNHTTPLIRYNLHDVATLSATPCSCGLPFPLLTGLRGRTDDLIELGNGLQRTPMDVLTSLYDKANILRQYQLRQLGLRSFELLIVPSDHFVPADAESLAAGIIAKIGAVDCTVRVVDSISMEKSGKRRAFVQLLPANARNASPPISAS